MNGLTEFLLARIAEDEAVAQEPVMFDSDGWARLADRVLAECEAKRRLIRESVYWSVDHRPLTPNARQQAEYTLRILALPYVDHPDCREEWRP